MEVCLALAVLKCRINYPRQQIQDVESMLVKRWSDVVNGGPTLNQH